MIHGTFFQDNGKKALQTVMCLCFHLFVGLTQVQTALAISSALAGSHDVGLVNDGNHQDVVFKHHYPHAQERIQHPAHIESSSIFDTHPEPHPDHVVHLPQPLEEINTHISTLNFDTFFLYDLDITPAVNGPFSHFCNSVSIHALSQPPPPLRQPSALAFLSTVVLLI